MVGSALDTKSGDQSLYKAKQMNAGVVPSRNVNGQVKTQGAPATGTPIAIGTQQPLADRYLVPVMLLLVDKTMGDELVTLGTVLALHSVPMRIQLQSELMQDVHILKKKAHGADFTTRHKGRDLEVIRDTPPPPRTWLTGFLQRNGYCRITVITHLTFTI